jgi:hypothetical protein
VLISLDSVTGFLNVIGLIDAGPVLLVNYASDEDRGGLIAGIEIEGAFGMLFGLFKASFFVSLRGFVELVLGSDFVYQRAARSGRDK